MIQKKRIALETNTVETLVDEANQESSWLVTNEYVDEVSESRYYAYQIVYSFINKSIMTIGQKRQACKAVVYELSFLSRKVMRSMKTLDIKMLSLTKFSAAIDVGIWSDSPDFSNPSLYYKDYE